jgi:hypothetical protein
MPAGEVSSITPLTDALSGLTGEGRPDVCLGYSGSRNFFRFLFIDFLVTVDNGFPGIGVNYFAGGQPPGYSLGK